MSTQRIFSGLLVIAAIFLVASSASLPPVVASHFVAGGVPDSYMPRAWYVALMLGFVVGLPALIVLSFGMLHRVPNSMINLPNREIWLAPERRADTFRYLSNHAARLGCCLVVFLCVVHGMVVQGNTVRPPHLSEGPVLIALAVFVLVMLCWIGSLIAHFSVRA